MKNIESYISELVGNHDCVIVPGFGAFIAQPTSADIHPITHKFTAPGRTLGFNAQIKVNDGLLASEISVNEKISFNDANTLIDEFVKKISSSLSLYKLYNFNGIGRFFYNVEGRLEFEPDYLINFSSDSFGLTDFVFKPIERNTYNMNQPTTHRNAKDASVKTIEKGEAAQKKSSSLTKVLLILMPLVVLIGAAGYVVYNQQQDISLGGISIFKTLGIKKEVVIADTTTKVATVDSSVVAEVEQAVEMPEEVAAVEETVVEEKPVSVKKEKKAVTAVQTADAVSGKYYVIVGSFKTESNADKLYEKLSAKGKAVTKLPIDANGYYKVAVGTFDSMEAANTEASGLEADFSGIWIKKY
jgi:cell division septation protein DedD